MRIDSVSVLLKRFDSCDFVFRFLFREEKKTTSRPEVRLNVTRLIRGPPNARLSSSASPLKLVWICQWRN